jgi:hypothetical protein
LWQLEQVPATDAEWTKVTVAQVVVEVWQVSHWAVVLTWVLGFIWALTAR